MKPYQKFLRLGISLAPVGIETGNEEIRYFCTPRGASLIGWSGVDGVHYCFVRGFGEMVFAVSPMNTAPDHVHPLARTFTDFLRLLLACGDAAVLEQAWMWDKAQFEAVVREQPATQEQQKTLDELAEAMHLTAMEQPWEYIRALQSSFDPGHIRYTEEYDDPDMNPAAEPIAPEWKVYFDGSFWGHHGRNRAGTEIPLGTSFEWAGRRWLIPAAYACGRGLVVDLCMRVEAEEIRAFRQKWKLRGGEDPCEERTREQQMELERENPLSLRFDSLLELNGQTLRPSHGCSVTCQPCLPDGVAPEWEARRAVEHYGLDPSAGWVICREAFAWKGKRRPNINTLSLTLHRQPVPIPGPRFTVHAPGDTFCFTHPVSRTAYTLTVRELERQTLPQNSFGSGRLRYPTHFTAMTYTLLPKPAERMTVSDCDDGDRPVETEPAGCAFAPAAGNDVTVGILGGADGPVALAFGGGSQGGLCTACSALRFEPANREVVWRMTFYETADEDITLRLIQA